MENHIYRKADIEELRDIITLKEKVKKKIIEDGLDIWQDDYPNDELLEDDIKKGYAHIVKIDGLVCGYAAVMPTDVDYGPGFYLDHHLVSFSRLMSDPKLRRSGIGRFIIERVIDDAKKEYDGVGITVDDINNKAVGLYRSYGFSKVGEISIPEAKRVLDKYVLLF